MENVAHMNMNGLIVTICIIALFIAYLAGIISACLMQRKLPTETSVTSTDGILSLGSISSEKLTVYVRNTLLIALVFLLLMVGIGLFENFMA